MASLCAQIAAALDVDPVTAQLAAYVHDYHRVHESRHARTGGPHRVVPSAEVVDEIDEILTAAAVPADLRAEIVEAVLFNERYRIKGDRLDGASIAALIVRDADKLDALGAIGIGRAFMYGGSLGAPMWRPQAELMTTYRSGTTSSVIAHFYEKLLHLPDEMLTDPGRAIAVRRRDVMVDFLRHFHDEWGDAESAPIAGVPGVPDPG